MTGITEYAVQYSAFRRGKVRTLTGQPHISMAGALMELDRRRREQADDPLSPRVDARLVSRTVTYGEWTEQAAQVTR